jgi:hypothetical protein
MYSSGLILLARASVSQLAGHSGFLAPYGYIT